MIRKLLHIFTGGPDQEEALDKYQNESDSSDAESDSSTEATDDSTDSESSGYKSREDFKQTGTETFGDLQPKSQTQRTEDESPVPKLSDHHKNLIAPTSVRKSEGGSKLEIEGQYIRTLFVSSWPDYPRDSFLQQVISDKSAMNDISIHVRPYDSDEVIRRLEKEVQKAKNRFEETSAEGSLISEEKRRKDAEQTQQVFDQVSSGSKLFDVGFYITIRAETEKQLENATTRLLKKLRTDPAYCQGKIPIREQLDAFRSVNPVLDDQLNYTSEMVAGALGAMYPFSTTSYIESDGIDYGIHAGNQAPVIVDRFGERQTGYNQLTFGILGSGKSYGTKVEILRSYAKYDDIQVFMLDPLAGFSEINKALNGDEIIVGGTKGLNPLEIHPPTEDDPEKDPYGLQKSKVMEFFEMYFNMRDKSLGSIKNGRGILERAVDYAYRQNDIYPDQPDSFENESPTVMDVKEILIDMQENPEKYSDSAAEQNHAHIRDAASELGISFEQFEEGGEYHNLAQESEIDFEGNDVNYINLNQREGSSKTGLMMHLLLSEVYEAAKRHDGKTLFAIDEAHYLLKDAESASYLEQVVRHSRHADLGINFITQTIDEFFDTQEARKIVQMCSIKKFHRVEDSITDEMAETLGLTDKERTFIRTAQAGDPELDYSEALIGIEGQYIPIFIVSSDAEDMMITDPLTVDDLEQTPDLE